MSHFAIDSDHYKKLVSQECIDSAKIPEKTESCAYGTVITYINTQGWHSFLKDAKFKEHDLLDARLWGSVALGGASLAFFAAFLTLYLLVKDRLCPTDAVAFPVIIGVSGTGLAAATAFSIYNGVKLYQLRNKDIPKTEIESMFTTMTEQVTTIGTSYLNLAKDKGYNG